MNDLTKVCCLVLFFVYYMVYDLLERKLVITKRILNIGFVNCKIISYKRIKCFKIIV